MLKANFLRDPDDIEWLKSVHLKNLNPPDFKSYILYGNEDCPDRLELFSTFDPWYTDKPCATFSINSDGNLEAI